MENEKEILLELGNIFTGPGIVTPFVELKFRLSGKFGPDNVEEVLQTLVDKEILNRFEFNNTVNYKSKEEIPMQLDRGAAPAARGGAVGSSEQVKALSVLILAMADEMGNDKVSALADIYKAKFS
ncbi:MAG: hypothetical protein IH840_00930 [Candidatus Heimdallarchaeota archaeon]|nr:hypothetical protein [Candidatus Heimdallarchaeota archaeon]